MKTLSITGTDLTVSQLCYGMASFGTHVKGDDAYRLYDAFRQAGGSFFDTAHCYAFWMPQGLGASERMLGECMRRAGDEGKIVIATKGGHPAGQGYERPETYLRPDVIDKDVRESLQRLGVACVDVYLLHRDDPRVPVGEIVGMLNEHVAAGRLKYLGASNWSVQRIAEANAYAAAHGLRGFAISQPSFNLAYASKPSADAAQKTPVDGISTWHAQSKLPVMAYAPTANGYFATDGKSGAPFDSPVARERLARAKQLAQRLSCTPNQVALAYLMHLDFPVVPILGTTKTDHLQDALGSVNVKLTAADVRWLKEG